MAKGYELGLLRWGDGTQRLSFWASTYGRDTHFVLGTDGKAYRVEPDDNLIEVDLVYELRMLLRMLEIAEEQYEDGQAARREHREQRRNKGAK